MASNADIAANLLRAAARFFNDLAEQNPEIRDQMRTNAETYETVAALVQNDPTGETDLDTDQV